MFFYKIAQPPDLVNAIFIGNGHEDGLIKTAANNLHLAASHERAHTLYIFGMHFRHPLDERSREMQPHADPWMARKTFNKWEVRLLVSALHHVVEIADGLMGMNEQH